MKCWYKHAEDTTLHNLIFKRVNLKPFWGIHLAVTTVIVPVHSVSNHQCRITVLDNSLHSSYENNITIIKKNKNSKLFFPLYNQKKGQEKTSRLFPLFVGHCKAEIQAPWSNHRFWRDCFYHLWWYGNIIWENVKWWEEGRSE